MITTVHDVVTSLKKDSETIMSKLDSKEDIDILNWLTPIDYGPQQSDFIERRQQGTGQWFLELDDFKNWLNQSKITLFCRGMPGAGKTIMTSIVVEAVRTMSQNNDRIGIAYLYCNFRRQHEQKPIDLLASLLKQLIQQEGIVPKSMKSLYREHKRLKTRPSFLEISTELRSVIDSYQRAFIIVDALDECRVSDGDRKRFLLEILNIQARTGANLFVTSRLVQEIEKQFEGSVVLDIYAREEDVERYVDSHMARLPSFVSNSPCLRGKIKTGIAKAVDGM
jgi:Cdc6-like AAA superfamily ATPase